MLRCTFHWLRSIWRQNFLWRRSHRRLFDAHLRRRHFQWWIVLRFLCRCHIGESRVERSLFAELSAGDGGRCQHLSFSRQFVFLVVKTRVAERALPPLVIQFAAVVVWRWGAEAAHATASHRPEHFLDSLVHRRVLGIRCRRCDRWVCGRDGTDGAYERLHRRSRQLWAPQSRPANRGALQTVVFWLLTLDQLIATRNGRNVTHGFGPCWWSRRRNCATSRRSHHNIRESAMKNHSNFSGFSYENCKNKTLLAFTPNETS